MLAAQALAAVQLWGGAAALQCKTAPSQTAE